MVGRTFLNRYETIRLLGEGGMGRVYLARQLDLGRQVVVKVMHDHVATDPLFCERFQRETLLMARFQHPYAVTLYDASLNDPQGPCIVMEFIRGITLDVLLHRNGRLTPKRVGRLLQQLCEVLQAAHSEGIIHRDLKPANLMVVDPDTPYEMIKVMDFGLAKLLGPTGPMNVTGSVTDFAVGTPGYMCPEQARGEDMDNRGDLYSVGVILFELLTGRLPFRGNSTMDVLLAHATEEAPAFDQVGASNWVPRPVEEVVQSCLSKDPNQRPPNARALFERFQAALEMEALEPEAATTQTTPYPGQPQPKTVTMPLVADGEDAIVHQLEAWMPEMIASVKLRGFVQDAGGEVLESIPGRIRVRLGNRGSVYEAPGRSSFTRLLLGRRPPLIDLELRFERVESSREGLLRIVVVLKPHGHYRADDDEWRYRCGKIYCDLRAYLMGQAQEMAPSM
jgi:serine/threonine-protein kinase